MKHFDETKGQEIIKDEFVHLKFFTTAISQLLAELYGKKRGFVLMLLPVDGDKSNSRVLSNTDNPTEAIDHAFEMVTLMKEQSGKLFGKDQPRH